jgi:putative transcription factor
MIHGHSGPDWDNGVFRTKAPAGAQKNSAQNVNAAMRSGAKVETMKKFGGANTSGASKNAAKLDAQNEAGRLNTVSTDMRKVIQQGRQAKKWSQLQLANAINQPPKTVQEYENGKAVPNPQIVSKIERALGVKLPRKKK